MRFKQYIEQEAPRHFSFEEALSAIRANCKSYLSIARRMDKPLLRGMRHIDVTKVSEMSHPVGRNPVDSGPGFNFMFNAGVYAAFEIEDIRTHSLFVTCNERQASDYGSVGFVMPAGHFKYLWSPYISDSYEDATSILHRIVQDGVLMGQDSEESIYTKLSKASEALSRIFDRAVKMKISPTEFARGKEAEKLEKILDLLDIEGRPDLYDSIRAGLYDAFEYLYVANLDLPKAADVRSEILIYESDGYYFVPHNLLAEEYKKDGETEVDSISDIWDWFLVQVSER